MSFELKDVIELNCIQTFTEKYFFYDDIESNEIDITDISWALSHQVRYNGHTKRPWTVAQHSLLVAQICAFDETLARYGLLHDAAEAYMGDLPGPLKLFDEMRGFRNVERRIECCIYNWFGLDPELPKPVKYADLIALKIEKQQLLGREGRESHWKCLDGVEIPTHLDDIELKSMPGKCIHNEFMAAWARLQR